MISFSSTQNYENLWKSLYCSGTSDLRTKLPKRWDKVAQGIFTLMRLSCFTFLLLKPGRQRVNTKALKAALFWVFYYRFLNSAEEISYILWLHLEPLVNRYVTYWINSIFWQFLWEIFILFQQTYKTLSWLQQRNIDKKNYNS